MTALQRARVYRKAATWLDEEVDSISSFRICDAVCHVATGKFHDDEVVAKLWLDYKKHIGPWRLKGWPSYDRSFLASLPDHTTEAGRTARVTKLRLLSNRLEKATRKKQRTTKAKESRT